MQMRKICVFCGSSMGVAPAYQKAARDLGRFLVQQHLDLVYGGGGIGLMGILADTVLSLGGSVYGVITDALMTREVGHCHLTELLIVPTMHERKAQMSSLADGFIALPGGFGTFEELFEVITWAQLGLHSKPIGLMNVEGYFTPLLELIDHGVQEGFILSSHRRLVMASQEAEALLSSMRSYSPDPGLDKWVD
jgi:uncharacterized protein (TIGR00730 family)